MADLMQTEQLWPASLPAERRRPGRDRRQKVFYSVFYGGVFPRRRSGRRAADHEQPLVDWHSPGLLASSLLVLLLSVADAFLTLELMSAGAVEANPLMAPFVAGDPERFAIAKLAMTGIGLLVLVAIARFKVFRFVRVGVLVHAVLLGYVALIGYELMLLAAHS
jgi:Domain of unknown function (DUF5658)